MNKIRNEYNVAIPSVIRTIRNTLGSDSESVSIWNAKSNSHR